MKVDKNIHSGFEEWKKIPLAQKTGSLKNSLFGKYQYICSSKKGKISIVSFTKRITDGDWKWEIYAYEGLFRDVQRFKTLKEAKAKAMEYLD